MRVLEDAVTGHWELVIGAIGAIAMLWGRIKQVADAVARIVVVRVTVEDEVRHCVARYLLSLRRPTPTAGYYTVYNCYSRSQQEYVSIPAHEMSPLEDAGLYWVSLRPIWMSFEHEQMSSDQYKRRHYFSFIRGTLDWEALLVDAYAHYRRLGDRRCEGVTRFYIHHVIGGGNSEGHIGSRTESAPRTYVSQQSRLLGWDETDVLSQDGDAIDTSLVLSEDLVEVTAEIQKFFTLKRWYADRGVSWRRSYLYKGPPGTGKSSHVRHVARKCRLPITVFHIASLTNFELHQAMQEVRDRAPCFVLIEDIDRVFHGDQNVVPSSKLAFQALLQALDGIQGVDGVVTIITANHPDKLDPALVRKGRVDRVVTFGMLTLTQRLGLAQRVLTDPTLAAKVVAELGPCSGADLREHCTKLAISMMFEQDEKEN